VKFFFSQNRAMNPASGESHEFLDKIAPGDILKIYPQLHEVIMNQQATNIAGLFVLVLLLWAGPASTKPQCEPPVFVECPDIIRACLYDSVFARVKAFSPHHAHAKGIRYHLVSGLGQVDEKTGVWSFCLEPDPNVRIRGFQVEISASIGNSDISTTGDDNCRFTVRNTGLSGPGLSIEGQKGVAVFRCEAPGAKSVQLSLYNPGGCSAEMLVTVVTPQPKGSVTLDENLVVTFTADAGDVGRRFFVTVKADNRVGVGTILVVFDTRTTIEPPVFVECPDSMAVRVSDCNSAIVRLKAVDPEFEDSVGVTYRLVSGEGVVRAREGIWQIYPEENQIGQTFDIEVAATYAGVETSGDHNCRFRVTVLGQEPPDFSAFPVNPCGKLLKIPHWRDSTILIKAWPNDGCHSGTYFLSSISPQPSGTVQVGSPDGSSSSPVWFGFTAEDAGKMFDITVGAALGGDTAFCSFSVLAISPEMADPIIVRIGNPGKARTGQHVTVPVSLGGEPYEIGGFNLYLAYNASVLGFQKATEGRAFFSQDSCGWEYFTYRFGADGNCSDACPSGLFHVIGIAETNNGNKHPICYTPAQLPAALFDVDFLVSSDTMFQCAYTPIQFFWTGCYATCMSSRGGYQLYISNHVWSSVDPTTSAEPVNIADTADPAGYPTYHGAQASDCPTLGNTVPLRFIDFYNGGVGLACPDSIDYRGDVNLNEVPYEVSDWVLFSNYFIYGTRVFHRDLDLQIAATDVNCDGVPLTVADLVVLARIIDGTLPPHFVLSSDTARLARSGSAVSLDLTGTDSLGALLLVFDGDVSFGALPHNTECLYNFDGQVTRLLIQATPGGKAVHNGPLLSMTGYHELLEVQAATYLGATVVTVIEAATDAEEDLPNGLPSRFALHQNFPNPFNASTVIGFDLPRAATVEFEIVNVLGEVVFSRVGQYPAGSHEINWDGTNRVGSTVSSGVYYYRLRAGDAIESKKMVLLK
jgi:hypothetical protein